MVRVPSHAEIAEFAREHLATERSHLALLDGWLPSSCKSRLLPLWCLSGWILGVMAATFGRRTAYATIDAVETFVVAHYQAQIDQADEPLRSLLEALKADESEHRRDARQRYGDEPPTLLHRLWAGIVGSASAAAVVAARHM